ncbi:sulfite exporter TauE/SafE family protein [Catalinimonas niigatensis]|uniref:sulfite exporter TauE/SafE family protein n=1 Tax=Catalinimonas niigatensis TaxID=1397264 RepID=UPI0026667AE7|nr:sulfite exporter TauE/SafE family protein [Catalinimonas niigatensis]WPP52351.1 sulfite exporter TauE/SafE family protein [Catalinimonas niigatensis]
MNWIELSPAEWGLVIFCAVMVGTSKAGISGAGIVVIPILANIFGGQLSTGFLLPILVIADIFAVYYYNRHAQWKYLLRLLPWTLVGIGIGVWVGDIVSDKVFKEMIAIVIFVCLALMFWQNAQKRKIKVPDEWWFSALAGLAGGFATMIGNAAGPIMAVYLLSMHLPKNHYIGTAAWFFLIINVLKLPFHFFIWQTITLSSLLTNITLIPAIAGGAFFGFFIVKKFPERAFRIFIILTTALSSILLLF